MIWTSFVTFSSLKAVAVCPGFGNRIIASASIAEADAEAEVEGTLKETNIFSGSASFPATSNKSY